MDTILEILLIAIICASLIGLVTFAKWAFNVKAKLDLLTSYLKNSNSKEVLEIYEKYNEMINKTSEEFIKKRKDEKMNL